MAPAARTNHRRTQRPNQANNPHRNHDDGSSSSSSKKQFKQQQLKTISRKKKQHAVKYCLGLKRIGDHNSNNRVIALPVGKYIGRAPKDASVDWHIPTGIVRENGGEIIPRKLFRVLRVTSESVALGVSESRNAPKLIKYQRHQHNQERVIQAGTRELTLGPNDILKVHAHHVFQVVPCPETPENAPTTEPGSPASVPRELVPSYRAAHNGDSGSAVAASNVVSPAKNNNTRNERDRSRTMASAGKRNDRSHPLEDTTNSSKASQESSSQEDSHDTTKAKRSNLSAVAAAGSNRAEPENRTETPKTQTYSIHGSRRSCSGGGSSVDATADNETNETEHGIDNSPRRSVRRSASGLAGARFAIQKHARPDDSSKEETIEAGSACRRSGRRSIAAGKEPANFEEPSEETSTREIPEEKKKTGKRRSSRRSALDIDEKKNTSPVSGQPSRAGAALRSPAEKSPKKARTSASPAGKPAPKYVSPEKKGGNILMPPGMRPLVPAMIFFQQMTPSYETPSEDEETPAGPPSDSGEPSMDANSDDDYSDDGDDDDDAADNDDESEGPRDMHISLSNAYWRALNSPQPQLGAHFFHMLLDQHQLPTPQLCRDLVKLLTFGPELRKYPYYDGHRLHLAFGYVEKLVKKFPDIMYPRLGEAMGGVYWKSALDHLMTLPYGGDDVENALSLHVFNVRLLDTVLRGLFGMDNPNSLPLVRDMVDYGASAACRAACQSMAAVWVKYGHYLWEVGHPPNACHLAFELTNRLGGVVVRLLGHFKIPQSDCLDMLWNAMDGQIRASDRKNDKAWARQLKLYWVPTLEQHHDKPWALSARLAKRAGIKDYASLVGR